jgi:diguanylate cyclase (GGDEF)-like protein
MTEDDRLERLQKLLLSLNAISTAASDSDGLLELVVGETMLFTDASGAVVEMVDGQGLVCIKAAGQLTDCIDMRVPRQQGLSGICVSARAIQRCDDTEKDDRVDRDACRRIGIRSMLVVPLVFNDEVVGVLKAASDRCAAFTNEHVQALQLAAGIIAAVVGRQFRIESSERFGEVLSMELQVSQAEGEGYRQAAMVDPLTGLPNRRRFDEVLDVAVFHGADVPGTMALLFIDMDGLKAVNDEFGHEAGDQALRRVAEVLGASVRDTDFVARLAGDEFVVLMRYLVEPQRQVAGFCRHCMRVFEDAQMLADGSRLKLSISIGAAFHDSASLSRSEWLRRADDAMYHAKQTGRFQFYGHYEPTLRVAGTDVRKA